MYGIVKTFIRHDHVHMLPSAYLHCVLYLLWLVTHDVSCPSVNVGVYLSFRDACFGIYKYLIITYYHIGIIVSNICISLYVNIIIQYIPHVL